MSGTAAGLVSVVIPAFNGERFVGQTIASALAQTYAPVEIIVVDDGSTDRTPEILRRFGERVRCVRQQNQGGPAARNKGISLARGDLVAFLDQDDTWSPDKLERQAAVFLQEPRADVCFTRCSRMDEQGNPVPDDAPTTKKRLLESLMKQARPLDRGATLLPRGAFIQALMVRCLPWSCSGVMARKAALVEVGGFDAGLPGPDDWDLWLRLAVGHDFVYIPEELYQYRTHQSQHTRQGTRVMEGSLVIAHNCLRSPEMCRLVGRASILRRIARLHDLCAAIRVRQGEMRKARSHYLAALRAQPKISRLGLWAATCCAPVAARLLAWRENRWDEHESSEEERS